MDLSALTVGEPEKLVAGLAARLGVCRSVEDAAQLLCAEMYERCRLGFAGERSLVLSYLFLSLPFAALNPENANQVKESRRKPDEHFLVQIGGCGVGAGARRPVSLSAAYQGKDPMLSRVFKQIGFEPGSRGTEGGAVPSVVWAPLGLYLVEKALGDPSLPFQEEFIKPQGIQSVVGSGATLPDGAVSIWIGFSRHPLTEEGVMPLLTLLPAFWHAGQALYRRKVIFAAEN